MSVPYKHNIKIYQGSTFSEVIRWESATKIYKPITNITAAAPAVITAVGHGMPVGWRFKVSNVSGMEEVNTNNYIVATNTTTDSVTCNDLNSVGYTAYTSGGILVYNAPTSLNGITARMQIRNKVSSTTTIDELTTVDGGIVIDDTLKTITINIDAITTAAYTFKTAVYSLEAVNGSEVTLLVYGNVTLDTEITR